MTESLDKNNFLYPQNSYRGQLTPEHLLYNANLQELAQKVSYISALETGGKISATQAYEQIKHLWKEFKYTTHNLGIVHKD
ncbi:DUF7219 family protein [Aerosakkonema funiforme]|uniref:Isopropylmalate/homocitrate/citramalate synthases n=1 Tax=Aerosakkonema funiforme FACHB-1375 TaxID=2949571 RepID=A0A926VEA0_9CYAN|nr:hypothetical protein [Aerosakkonema funiforme]MBD2181638.1 hypothetical protein [Aerosakkonema funiforme FACHB-1375]